MGNMGLGLWDGPWRIRKWEANRERSTDTCGKITAGRDHLFEYRPTDQTVDMLESQHGWTPGDVKEGKEKKDAMDGT